MLTLSGAAKQFGYFTVWKDLHFSVQPGEVLGLFGANGAGKTTLLKCIAGISALSSGQIRFDDKQGKIHSKLRSVCGFLSHNSGLYHDFTPLENLKFAAALQHLALNEKELRIKIAEFGLEKWGDTPVKNFSRGMTQRLALLKTLLHAPEVLLLDEPFTGLDERAIQKSRAIIENARISGKITLLVTHDLQTGYDASTRLMVLSRNSAPRFYEKNELDFQSFHQLISDIYGAS